MNINKDYHGQQVDRGGYSYASLTSLSNCPVQFVLMDI